MLKVVILQMNYLNSYIVLLHCLRLGRKEENMTNSDNKIEFEMSIKFKIKDYRLRLVSKKAWVTTIIIISLRLLYYVYGDSSP